MRRIFLFILISLFLSGEAGRAQVPITSMPVKPAEQIVAPADPFQEKISLDYKDADISTIIRSLSYTYGLNLVTSSEVKGKITVSLKDVTLAEALDVILMANGYNYTHKGSIIYITPGSAEGAQLVSEPITLEYIKAGDAQNLLRKVLSPKGDIKVDETFNLLVVTDYPANVERLKALLKSVDQAPQQVLIEAKIVDITSKDLQNLGVTWQIDYNPLHGLWSRGTEYDERAKGTGNFAGTSSSLSSGQIRIDTFILKGLTATATLDALIQDQKAHLLASPSIAVINNREARIIIGEKVPYKERTQTTTGTTETTKFIDVGTTLRVTPSINEDGYITMAIHPEVSSVKALLDAGPQITTREADTIVRVKEGETIVIGGLIKQEDNRVVSRMPILGYIPLIGYLFGSRSKDQTQQELTVFITPKILRSPEELIAHGKKRFEDEAIINITTTGSLNAQKALLEKANHLDAAVGVESRRKEDWMLKNQAVSIYESILSQFPTGPVAPESGYRAARIYFNDLNEPYRARELCAVLISNYPNSPYAYHAKELYKKIVTILEKERLEKLKKAGKRDVLRDEEDKNKAMGSAIDRALDKEKIEEVRAVKEEARQAREEEQRIARAKAETERAAKLEEKRKAEEERKQKIEDERKTREAERTAKIEAQRKAEEERKQNIEEARKAREDARQAREEEQRIAREKAQAERTAKIEAQRKAKENAEEIKRVEAELRATERAKREQARETAAKVREEEKR
ncbi:MAG: secretin N-terminal domain-containing protein, partial [Candidatus Omnitrophota bacterium]